MDTCNTSFRALQTLITRCNPDIGGDYYCSLVESSSKEVEEYKTQWNTHRVFARKKL